MLEKSQLPASACAALRFVIAAVVMTPGLFTLERGKSYIYDRDVSWCFAVELGTWLAFGYGLQTIALTRCQPVEASIYLALFLVLVPVFERFHGRFITRSTVIALLLSLGGLVIMSLDPISSPAPGGARAASNV